MSRVSKFFSLPSSEQHLLIKAFILMWAFRLGQWLFPFQRLQYIIAHLIHTPKIKHINNMLFQERIAWAVEAVSRYVLKATCLTRALTLYVLLQKEGYDATLHIGVIKNDNSQFQAHAWVECQGEVFIGRSEVEQYIPLCTLVRKR